MSSKGVDPVGTTLAIDMKGVGKRYPLGQDHRWSRSLPESFLRRFGEAVGTSR